LTNLRMKLLNSNSGLNYYIIKVIFPKQCDKNNHVYYYNIQTGDWIKRFRKYNNINGPFCL